MSADLQIVISALNFEGTSQEVYTLLRWNDEPTVAYSSWLQFLTNFYTQIKNTLKVLAKAEKVNIKEADVGNALAKMETLRELKKSQRKEIAEAQAANETHDKAFDELYPHYRKFIDYTKNLFSDN